MGRAIIDRNDIDKLKMEMKEIQGVVAELSEMLVHNTQVRHVDLHSELDKHERNIRAEGGSTSRRKKTTKVKTTTVE